MPFRFLCAFAIVIVVAMAPAHAQQSQPGLLESLGNLLKPKEEAAVGDKAVPTRNINASATTKRIALVIGNDAYKHVPPLEKAANDARAMGRALQQAGFETRTVLDANRTQMNKAINQFADDVAGGGIGVFFFAGHGVQVNNQNFLIPIDLQDIQREADVADQGVSLQGMQDKLAEVRAKFSLLVIDACRDNPLPKKAGRALGGTRGLSQASSAEGQMVVFSAGANQQALDKLSDNDRNPNGVFTREFLPWLAKPGVSIRDAVQGVRSAVRARAKSVNHEQFPAIYDQAEGNFYFTEGDTQVAQLGPGIGGRSRTPEQIEDELWDAIKDGDRASVLEEYLKQYPKGRYLAQAKVKIAKLKAEAKQPAPIAVPPAPTPVATASSDPETALWSEVQKGNTADDYDVYLKQYPKGKYVALAKQRLQKLKDEARQKAEAAEQNAWQTAEGAQTAAGYTSYLAKYPNGKFAALAQTRTNKLNLEASERATQEAARLQKMQEEATQREAERARQEAARVAEQERKAREEAARGPQWADSDNGYNIDWREAMAYCGSKGNGWRLPTSEELLSNYQSGRSTPCGSYSGTQYTCKISSNSRLTGLGHWTNEQKGSSEAWFVGLSHGGRLAEDMSNRSNYRALCVRRP